MTTDRTQQFTIQTPTGERQLYWVGREFAVIAKEVSGPGDPNKPRERLLFRSCHQPAIAQQPDGVAIGPEHLLTIAIAVARRRKAPVTVAEIVRDYFWPAIAPQNAAAAIAALPQDGEFTQLIRRRFTTFDADSGTIWPILS